MEDLQHILKEYVVYIFYSTQTKESFDSFLIDMSEPETSVYFHDGFVKWCKLNYNKDIKRLDSIHTYVNNAKYNSFGTNKFIITKRTMERVFKIGLVDEIEYNMNEETIVRSNIKRKINKK